MFLVITVTPQPNDAPDEIYSASLEGREPEVKLES